VVIAGVLDDPYTGQTVPFAKSDAAEVPIDHVVPLAAAWVQGRPSGPPTSGAPLPGWSAPPSGVVPGAASQAVSGSPGRRPRSRTYLRLAWRTR
jgi:hypothetical protein